MRTCSLNQESLYRDQLTCWFVPAPDYIVPFEGTRWPWSEVVHGRWAFWSLTTPCVFFHPSPVYLNRMLTVTYTFAGSMEREAREVARGLRNRDPELLDRLIEQFQYRLFRYLLYLAGSRETAEDLFQETWMRVLEKGYLYNGKSRFETWLFAIARNLFIDLIRRRAPMSLDQLTDPEDGSVDIPASETALPTERIAREEENRQMATILGRLPAAYREVLVLRFKEDLALDEIAAVVAAPLSTVKSRLYRGLDLMREALEEGGL